MLLQLVLDFACLALEGGVFAPQEPVLFLLGSHMYDRFQLVPKFVMVFGLGNELDVIDVHKHEVLDVRFPKYVGQRVTHEFPFPGVDSEF